MDIANIALIFFVLLLSGIGILGCILPALPGPPISYAAIVLYHFMKGGGVFSFPFMVISFGVVIAVVVLDYALPVYATKRFGGSKQGVWGGVIGLVVGLIFSPFGFISIIICPLLGAIIGDMVGGREFHKAMQSGAGSFIGFMVATGVKLAVSITLTVFLIIEII